LRSQPSQARSEPPTPVNYDDSQDRPAREGEAEDRPRQRPVSGFV
jgi:hypothetical protein